MLISVIIPAHNEAHRIDKCLRALHRQTLSAERFEIIVVDNGSTDATAAISGMPWPNIRVLKIDRVNISHARNLGAAQAKGNILAFLDADCIPHRDWLANGYLMAIQSNGVWGGYYQIPEDSTYVGRLWDKYQFKQPIGDVSYLPGGCIFMRADEFLGLGGFDESLVTSEDVDLCRRARAQGMKVRAYRDLEVVHDGTPRTLRQFFSKNHWHGRSVVRMFFKNLPSTKNLPLVALAFYTMLCLCGVCASAFLFGPMWLAVSLALLLAPAIGIAAAKSGISRDMPGLALLYLTYLTSRAAAIIW